MHQNDMRLAAIASDHSALLVVMQPPQTCRSKLLVVYRNAPADSSPERQPHVVCVSSRSSAPRNILSPDAQSRYVQLEALHTYHALWCSTELPWHSARLLKVLCYAPRGTPGLQAKRRAVGEPAPHPPWSQGTPSDKPETETSRNPCKL